jgi:DNA polymerase III epsilon subunit-like protein
MGLNYYILDTETCGLSVDYHEINQISVMRVCDEKQISIQIKVKHPNSYNIEALNIQGITPDDLKIGKPLEEAVEEINIFLNEDGKTPAHRCIVAHNASFDRKFVYKAWDTVKKVFPSDLWICTQSFAKRYIAKNSNGIKIAQAQIDGGVDNIKTDKNGKLKVKFGLNNFMVGVGLPLKSGSHQASVDVQNTKVLFNWLMNSGTEYLSLIERVPHHDKKNIDLDINDF